MALLEVSRISKKAEGEPVLDDISFDQDSGEQIAIAGESGAGKTTLLRVIAGLVQPDSGQVLFNAEKVQGPLEKLVPGHPRIGYLSQHFDLRNNYRVEEILRYANELSDIDASNLYETCRIDHLLKRWTHQVSGGEKQRIALARLLTTAPRLLLLDEPYSNLDPILKNILKTVVQDLGEKLKITCLLTSHDPNDTLSWAHQIMVMKSGRIIQQGSPGEIYRFPINEYAAGLFGRYISVDAPLVSAFPSLEGTIQFLRPEDFILTRDPQGSIQASVAAVRYMGSYDEVDVIIPGNTTVTVRHPLNEIRKGEQIFVSLQN